MELSEKFNFVSTVLSRANPNNTAFIENDQRWTYQQLGDNIRSVAGWLSTQGIQPEQRVAIIMRDGCDTAALILGCMYAGIVAVPLDPRSSIETLRHCVDHCGARLVITEDHDMKEKLELPAHNIHPRSVMRVVYRCAPATAADTQIGRAHV